VKLWFYVEGQTEELFVNRVLRPHLTTRGIMVSRPILAATGLGMGPTTVGGSSNPAAIEADLRTLLAEDMAADDRLTTLFDLYGLPLGFPGKSEAEATSLRGTAKAEHIEREWQEQIGDSRFHPYIQIHEFEALLLADTNHLGHFYGHDAHGLPALRTALARCATPEDVTEHPQAHPGEQLRRAINGYRKTEAWRILQEVGLDHLRHACPRFGRWLTACESGLP
jgi:hypothetical protein